LVAIFNSAGEIVVTAPSSSFEEYQNFTGVPSP
jgi:hypothetical protein